MGSTDTGAEVTATLTQLASIDASDPTTHQDIIQKCRSVIHSLQDPLEPVYETLACTTKHACIVALGNLGAFEKLSAEPITAEELAMQCGADRQLIVRLMRMATACEIVHEAGPESYAAVPTSRVLATPAGTSGLRHSHFVAKVAETLPEYLQQSQYRNPTSYTKGPFQHRFNTPLGSFEWLAQPQNAALAHDFNIFMTIQRTRGDQWTKQFNIASRIFDGIEINPSAPLVVDVAGGVGQDLSLIKKELPPDALANVKGQGNQLVLADQPSVINDIPDNLRDEDFTYLSYDFFTPQPVRGARIYSFKSIMHDWPDEKAVEILRNTAGSMEPGYSKIWILDAVVPNTGADRYIAGLDICMMVVLAGLERTEVQWGELLAKAGLKIVGISITGDHYGLIEAVLDV
ncbi:S-adenosyl-L-methionine-dependent methyltransferase [Aspergillus varians]